MKTVKNLLNETKEAAIGLVSVRSNFKMMCAKTKESVLEFQDLCHYAKCKWATSESRAEKVNLFKAMTYMFIEHILFPIWLALMCFSMALILTLYATNHCSLYNAICFASIYFFYKQIMSNERIIRTLFLLCCVIIVGNYFVYKKYPQLYKQLCDVTPIIQGSAQAPEKR